MKAKNILVAVFAVIVLSLYSNTAKAEFGGPRGPGFGGPGIGGGFGPQPLSRAPGFATPQGFSHGGGFVGPRPVAVTNHNTQVNLRLQIQPQRNPYRHLKAYMQLYHQYNQQYMQWMHMMYQWQIAMMRYQYAYGAYGRYGFRRPSSFGLAISTPYFGFGLGIQN